jgi:DegV family protein with EDD domain
VPGVFVVTDSSCDLEQDDIDSLNIEIVPLTIRFGSEEFVDRQDLSVEGFYQRMANTEDLPETACPSPGAFEQAFRNAIEAGAEALICLTISSDLSATFQSALTAAATLEGQIAIDVIDSRSVSSGLGTIVIEAARAAAEGADIGEIGRRVSALIARTHVIAALNTLDNLRKGGRIGSAAAMVGSLLSIKPVIDLTGGTVHETGRARTRKKALQMLYERMGAAGSIEHIAVMHCDAHDIDQFLELIAPRFPGATIRIGKLGAVVGVHGGAQIIGVSWIGAA